MENTETIPKEKYGRLVMWVFLMWIMLLAFLAFLAQYVTGFYSATDFNTVLIVFFILFALSPFLAIGLQKLYKK